MIGEKPIIPVLIAIILSMCIVMATRRCGQKNYNGRLNIYILFAYLISLTKYNYSFVGMAKFSCVCFGFFPFA